MMTIQDYLNKHLPQQWNNVRLQTLVGNRFLQGIGKELESLVNVQYKIQELDEGYNEAKNIPGIKNNDDIIAAFIFNMKHILK
ncbi:hypothetical protein [Bacillus cereus]|uniref:hypothetical protein n=1 Tax=Bacillus cereus TaxID=1396 RepID=UPI000BF3AD47|nr:hypothetical protein [Bacillus cereus]MDA2548868.1 hypothetical protein [Bacillus cereus]MDA2553488.1 hypothetical protein [Bacillus cereus]MDA2648569.1 hypothetical protein [Bacillus cereus]PEV25958.1 hypothetical protein CN419_24500 [Bacillus cereus]WBV48960.1 hypothetical protein PFY08_04890 [Bacillus cereus]